MLRHLPILLSLFIGFTTSAQDPIEILKGAYKKCQSVKNGYYEMSYYMETMSGNNWDLSYWTHFKRRNHDTLSAVAFHTQRFLEGKYDRHLLYTGNEFVRYTINDSTGVILENAKWGSQVRDHIQSYDDYRPFMHVSYKPLPADSDYFDQKHIFQFVSEQEVNGYSCYHVKMNRIPEYDSTTVIQELRAEYHFWLNKIDSVPVQYTVDYDLLMGQDTMYQFERIILTDYELNNLQNESVLTLESIPGYVELIDYEPYKSPKPLPVDTVAPEWSLPNLEDDTVRLSDLKGELVLIDFFYMWCYPCLAALPALQKLHEKYRDKGVRIIGVNPFDTKEDGIVEFLAKRNVNYTVVLGTKEVAKMYRVAGYPTMYLLDKQGKIIMNQVGYGEGVEEKIEEMILKHL